jgi:hypothetical protein
MYGRNCELLVQTGIPFYYSWTALDAAPEEAADDESTDGESTDGGTTDGGGSSATLELPVPPEVRDADLASLGVLVRPAAGTSVVSGRAVVTDADGDETVLTAEAELPADGGLLQFLGAPTPLVDGARSVRLEFTEPVEVAALDGNDLDTAIVLWMGQPGS